jgi:hypothetical protein
MEGVAAAEPITKASTANTAMIASGSRLMVAPLQLACRLLQANHSNLHERLSSVRWVTLAQKNAVQKSAKEN